MRPFLCLPWMRTGLGLLAVLAAGCKGGGDEDTPRIRLADPWARAMPFVVEGEGPPLNSAVYLQVRNRGEAADRLLGGETPAAAAVELHESFLEGEVMRMREVGELEIPPGGTVELRPGGLHVMLLGLTGPLREGDHLELTLHFQRSGDVHVTVPIRAPASG